MLARVASQEPRRPQLVRIAQVLRLATGQRDQPCLGLGGDRRLLARPAPDRRAPLLVGPAYASAPDAHPPEIHYSPEERLDRIDVALIAAARTRIHLASYALTDRLVIDALLDAKNRVAVRIVLDPREPDDYVALCDLADVVKVKRGGALMHPKAYEIDGEVVRTG